MPGPYTQTPNYTVDDEARERMTERLAAFELLVQRHDLTHECSDDGNVSRAGREELRVIREAAKALPAADVARIWNAAVDRNFQHQEDRERYYWKEGA
jgi:hypothetical protein